MAEENGKKRAKLKKLEGGRWQRENRSGEFRDLEEEWEFFVLDVHDVSLVRSMTMEVASTGSWIKEDSYSQVDYLKGVGRFLGWDHLKYADQPDDDYSTRIHHCEVLIRFERAWNDPPIPKIKFKPLFPPEDHGDAASAETEDSGPDQEVVGHWSIGESQAGSFYDGGDRYLHDDDPDPLPYLHLKAPSDFLPAVIEAMEDPTRVGRVRLRIDMRCLSDSDGNKRLVLRNEIGSPLVYLKGLEIESVVSAPLPPKNSPPSPSVRPQTQSLMSRELEKVITQGIVWITVALALIAIALLFGLRR